LAYGSFSTSAYNREMDNVKGKRSAGLSFRSRYHHLRVVFPPSQEPPTVGRRSFPVAASFPWNSLPPAIQSPSSFADFCQRHICSTNHFQTFCFNYPYIDFSSCLVSGRTNFSFGGASEDPSTPYLVNSLPIQGRREVKKSPVQVTICPLPIPN